MVSFGLLSISVFSCDAAFQSSQRPVTSQSRINRNLSGRIPWLSPPGTQSVMSIRRAATDGDGNDSTPDNTAAQDDLTDRFKWKVNALMGVFVRIQV
jgi:hypothetical protein